MVKKLNTYGERLLEIDERIGELGLNFEGDYRLYPNRWHFVTGVNLDKIREAIRDKNYGAVFPLCIMRAFINTFQRGCRHTIIAFLISQLAGLGFDSNIYLILDDVTALVDAGTGMNFDRVRGDIRKFGVELNDIDLLINTHCHFDQRCGEVLKLARDAGWLDMSRSTLNDRLSRYGVVLGFRLTPHMLRHTFNTHMRDALKDDILVEWLMGHTARDMTDVYTDVFEERIREAMVDRHYMRGIKFVVGI